MNRNLINRPRNGYPRYTSIPTMEQYEKWFEEFEKESEDIISHIQTVEIVKIMKENPNNHVDVAFQAGRIAMLKEIRGETS